MKAPFIFFNFILLIKDSGFIHWLEHNLLGCPIKKFTGADCPGCGLQRSVIALFKGDLLASLKFYPATLPILGLFIFALLHLKFDYKNGAFLIRMLYIGVTLIIVINYIYKIFTNQLF